VLIIVRAPEDVPNLRVWRGLPRQFAMPELSLRVPQMAAPEARGWEGALNRLRRECGCFASALAICAFMADALAWLLASGAATLRDSRPAPIVFYSLAFLAGLIVSAVAGKLAGLQAARLRFRRACARLRERVATLQVAE
jgi:hypothetical protein